MVTSSLIVKSESSPAAAACALLSSSQRSNRVRDVLAYLQLADNPSYTAAFTRVINTPRRGVGDKTVRDLLAAAKQRSLSAFEVCVKVANGSGMAGVTSAQRKGIRAFVETIRDLKQMAEEGKSVSDLIDVLCEKVGYRVHLDKTQGPDAQERWENVEELKVGCSCAVRSYI